MRRLGLVAAVPMAALLVSGVAVAQDENDLATDRVVSPEECTAEPISVDDMVTYATTDVAEDDLQVPLSVPLGTLVDNDTRDAVSEAVRGVVSCFNANDRLRAATYMSDKAIRRFFGAGLVDDASIETFRATFDQEPQPRAEEEFIRLTAVTDVSETEGGLIEAFVVLNEPLLDPRGNETLLFSFVREGDAILVDNFVDFSQPEPEAAGTPEATPANGG